MNSGDNYLDIYRWPSGSLSGAKRVSPQPSENLAGVLGWSRVQKTWYHTGACWRVRVSRVKFSDGFGAGRPQLMPDSYPGDGGRPEAVLSVR